MVGRGAGSWSRVSRVGETTKNERVPVETGKAISGDLVDHPNIV